MRRNTIALAAAALATAGVVGVTGAALAAAADDSATPSPSATSSSAPRGDAAGRPGGSQDTAVTGSEADKVIAAVKAEDSAVTITTVRKDPDGSYDAIGTKAGSPVFYDVSADLKTVTAATGGPGGGHHGGPGGPGVGHPGGPSGSGATGGAGTLPGGSGGSSSTSSDPTDANTTAYVV